MNMLKFLLAIIMFSVFFGNSLASYGIIPNMLNTLLPDMAVGCLVFLAIITLKNRNYSLKCVGIGYVSWLLIFTILSSIITESSILNTLLFLRLVVRFFVMFIALLNIGLTDEIQKWCFKILSYLFLIQIPVSVAKLFAFGQGESAIGTYATHGGGLSTAIPMVAAAFLVSFYIGYRQRLLYLVFLAGFIAFGIIGGKRAIFILVPLIGFLSLLISVDFSIIRLFRHMSKIINVFIILSFAFYASVKLTPTLNPERIVMGSFDLEYLTEFVTNDQLVSYSASNESQGRFSSTLAFLDGVNDSPSSLLVGFGPGTLLKTSIEGAGREKTGDGIRGQYDSLDQFGVIYGITGFTWLLVQIGWPGTIIWLSFYFYLFKCFIRFAKIEKTAFWRSYHQSMAGFSLVVLLISILYGSYMIMGDLMLFVFFLTSSISFIRHYNN